MHYKQHHTQRNNQSGMTLIEVLISVLILAIGLLGAAAIQLNALKYTDSSRMTSQASFIAYDMLDRIRANPDADYRLANLAAITPGVSLLAPKDQDLSDFSTNIGNFGGANADGSITVLGRLVTISITWNDSRAGSSVPGASSTAATLQKFSVTSRVAIDPLVSP